MRTLVPVAAVAALLALSSCGGSSSSKDNPDIGEPAVVTDAVGTASTTTTTLTATGSSAPPPTIAPTTTSQPPPTSETPPTSESGTSGSVDLVFFLPTYLPAGATYGEAEIEPETSTDLTAVGVFEDGALVAFVADGDEELDGTSTSDSDEVDIGGVTRSLTRDGDGKVTKVEWSEDPGNPEPTFIDRVVFVTPVDDAAATTIVAAVPATDPLAAPFAAPAGYTVEGLHDAGPYWYVLFDVTDDEDASLNAQGWAGDQHLLDLYVALGQADGDIVATQPTTVHGHPATLVTFSDDYGGFALEWVEDGSILTIIGPDLDELQQVAAGIQIVDEATWRAATGVEDMDEDS